MKARKRRHESVNASADHPPGTTVRWTVIILLQMLLVVIALTSEAGTPTAARAQGGVVIISTLAILVSLLSMPQVGLAKVLHPLPIASLVLAVTSLVFVVDPSRSFQIGAAGAVAAVLALRPILAAWRAKAQR